jgi:gliding motility-associated-like protein
VQIGGPPAPGFDYSWTPVAEVSNPTIADPFAIPATQNPTMFIVKVVDQLTNCAAYDTTIITTARIDTSMTVTGPGEICVGETGPTLTASSAVASIQWAEQSTGIIPGATGLSYQPVISGTYYARVSQSGCIDSTRNATFVVHPLPLPSFNSNKDTGCVKVSSFLLTNTSTSPDAANMTFLWTFSDGITQTSTDVTRGFNTVGNYTVQLEATTEFGCKATSLLKTLYVLPGGKPNFTYDSICVGKLVTFRNLSNENGAAQANYAWDFNNGDPVSFLKNPLPVVFNIPPGKLDVTLKMTTLGCESDTQKMVRTVQVNKQAPGHTYNDITMPQGSTKFVHVRDSVGNFFSWRPRVNLSSYDTRYTEVTAVDDITYLIDITDKHTCVTTDTLSILVLKKPGFYLPSAFTPNGDGLNDLVRPYLVGMKGLKSFSVFNRWGNLIYYTEKYGEGWDGKREGVTQAAGVYVWILKFYNASNQLQTEKGTITLIR